MANPHLNRTATSSSSRRWVSSIQKTAITTARSRAMRSAASATTSWAEASRGRSKRSIDRSASASLLQTRAQRDPVGRRRAPDATDAQRVEQHLGLVAVVGDVVAEQRDAEPLARIDPFGPQRQHFETVLAELL